MDLTSKSTVVGLLNKYHGRPSKGLGQNFLVDKAVFRKIIEAADLDEQDIVLEIGPGIGNLTRELAKRAKRVIAAEKDEKMVGILKETLKDYKNVKIIDKDILKIENCKLKIENYKVVANLPYYITSPVIRKFLECENPPELMVLMIQKEVAQRICAKPPRMSLLAVSVQFYAEPNIVSYVSKKSFWPQPKVDGAILSISPSTSGRRASGELFFKVAKVGFSHPRKQLANNLLTGLVKNLPEEKKLAKEQIYSWFSKNNIHPTWRAERLSMDDWLSLASTYPGVNC